MQCAGLQKLTLLDYPGHLAATLFLDGCNFRCPFCHNSDLVLCSGDGREDSDFYSEEEVLLFLKKRAGMLDGVCISGGEPTLHSDLPDLIRRIRGLGYQVKLDTNGSTPQMLASLCEEGLLDYVAMDIKAGRDHYAAAAGWDGAQNAAKPARAAASLLEQVRRSAAFLMDGTVDYEFRTTVVRGIHTDEDFEDIAQWLSGCRRYYLQSFRDCDSILLPDHPFSAFPAEDMRRFLDIVRTSIPHAALREDDE